MRTILIGVTGASSSGKSTVAHILKRILPNCEIIHEDDFFKVEKDVPYDPVRKDRDWDCPEAVDFEAMRQTLNVLVDPALKDLNPRANVKTSDSQHYDYGMTSTEPPRNDANFINDETIIDNLKKVMYQKFGNERLRIFLVDGFLLLNESELMEMFSVTLFFKTNYRTLKERREKRIYTVEGNIWQDPPGYFDEFVWPGYYSYHKNLFDHGDNEAYIKETGGQLKPCFRSSFKVFEFDNHDSCDANVLMTNVANILQTII